MHMQMCIYVYVLVNVRAVPCVGACVRAWVFLNAFVFIHSVRVCVSF